MVSLQDRFKFVANLTVLEIVNILTIEITSDNLKQHIPADIPAHNQSLKYQQWLDEINQWTLNKKMQIN